MTTHAERIRAAVERAQIGVFHIIRTVATKAPDADFGAACNKHGAAMQVLEQIATELDQGWTREGNYVERAETEGDVHG